MMNPMGMAGMGIPGMMPPGFNNDMMGGQYPGGYDPNMAMGMGMGMFPPPPMDMSVKETIFLKDSTLFPPPPSKCSLKFTLPKLSKHQGSHNP